MLFRFQAYYIHTDSRVNNTDLLMNEQNRFVHLFKFKSNLFHTFCLFKIKNCQFFQIFYENVR